MIETIKLMKCSQLALSSSQSLRPMPRLNLSKLIMNFETSCFVISFHVNHIKYIIPWLDDESRILNNIHYVAVAFFLLLIARYLEDSKLNLLRQFHRRNDFNFKLDLSSTVVISGSSKQKDMSLTSIGCSASKEYRNGSS